MIKTSTRPMFRAVTRHLKKEIGRLERAGKSPSKELQQLDHARVLRRQEVANDQR
jgi:hypothetical protein